MQTGASCGDEFQWIPTVPCQFPQALTVGAAPVHPAGPQELFAGSSFLPPHRHTHF